jgi:hypothetical protein
MSQFTSLDNKPRALRFSALYLAYNCHYNNVLYIVQYNLIFFIISSSLPPYPHPYPAKPLHPYPCPAKSLS